MRSHRLLLLYFLCLLLANSARAQPGSDARLCVSAALSDPKASLESCSAAIGAGGHLPAETARLFNSRGIAHQALQEYTPAVQDYDQAIRLNPAYSEAFNNRGTAYHSKGIYDRAIQDYTAAIKLNPRVAVSFRSRGITHFCLGHFDEAQKDFQVALDLDPADAFAAIWLYIAQVRRDGVATIDFTGVASGLKLGEWPGPVVRLFSGALGPQDFFSAVEELGPGKDPLRRCEAMFFLGEYSLINGDRAKAMQLFQSVLDTRLTDDFEYTAALAELRRLRSP